MENYINYFSDERKYSTRSSIQKKTEYPFKTSFLPHCPKEWSTLSKEIRNISSIYKFKSSVYLTLLDHGDVILNRSNNSVFLRLKIY